MPAQTKLSKAIPRIWSQERNEGGCDNINNMKLLTSFSIIFKMALEEICESIVMKHILGVGPKIIKFNLGMCLRKFAHWTERHFISQ